MRRQLQGGEALEDWEEIGIARALRPDQTGMISMQWTLSPEHQALVNAVVGPLPKLDNGPPAGEAQ